MRFVSLVAMWLFLLAFAVAAAPKESDFPSEFTVVESGSYPNNVCWLVLRLGDSLYRVRDTGYFHTACLAVGTQVHGRVKGPTKAVPQRSWLGRMGSDVYVRVLHDDEHGKPTVTSYLVENITQAASGQ